MTNKIKTLISLLLATGLMAFGAAAHADSFTVELGTEISGGGPAPEGSTPWLRMTVDDGGTAGSVAISIEAVNLTDTEFVSDFYFNFNDALGSAYDVLGFASSIDTSEVSWWSQSMCSGGAVDCLKADGDGWADIRWRFRNGEFIGGETFSFTYTGAGVTASDFNFLSTEGGGNGTWTAVAHIQSIGDNGDSSWIGGHGDGNEIPEPGTLALFGLGLTAMGFATRRRRAAPKA